MSSLSPRPAASRLKPNAANIFNLLLISGRSGALRHDIQGARRMMSIDRRAISCDSRVGGTEPAKYRVYSNYYSLTYNEHDVCFHLRGRQNGSVKTRYFNGPAVDRDVSQPEAFVFGHIKGRLTCPSFEEPNQPLQAIDAIFQSIEEAILERVSPEWMDRLEQCCVTVGC
jgi:hypothetical protein